MKRLLSWIIGGIFVVGIVYAAEIHDLSTTDASNTARFPEGMAPSAVNDAARALEGILARGLKDTTDGYILTTGTSSAFTVTTNRTLSAYYDGLQQSIEFHTTPNAAPTVNLDSIGAKTLVWPNGTAIGNGDLASGSRAMVEYDSGLDKFQVLNPPGPFSVNALTEDVTPDGTADYVATYDASAGSNKKVLAEKLGRVVQIVTSSTSSVATGSTVMPVDDTIPQNTEGTQFLSASITPHNTNSTLVIDVTMELSSGTAAKTYGIALFQDSTANALTAVAQRSDPTSANTTDLIHFRYTMTAGTTSSTTFNVRAGPDASATITLNGANGSRYFGGVADSRITITEYLP